jgi:hypothetical protein
VKLTKSNLQRIISEVVQSLNEQSEEKPEKADLGKESVVDTIKQTYLPKVDNEKKYAALLHAVLGHELDDQVKLKALGLLASRAKMDRTKLKNLALLMGLKK